MVTEAQILYKRQLSLYRLNCHLADKESSSSQIEELYLIEAVYGSILLHFPTSASHTSQILQVLLSISALPGEDVGFDDDTNDAAFVIDTNSTSPEEEFANKNEMSTRRKLCNEKVDWLLRFSLGMDDKRYAVGFYSHQLIFEKIT